MDPILDVIKKEVARSLLRYAVGRSMLCARCSKVLDVSASVLFDVFGRTSILCAPCYSLLPDVTGHTEVYDGRVLFPPKAEATPRPPRQKRAPAPRPAEGETWEAKVSGRLVSVTVESIHEDSQRIYVRYGPDRFRRRTRYAVLNRRTGRRIVVSRNRLRRRMETKP